ncbi:hypothetical protein [Thiomonas sp.]
MKIVESIIRLPPVALSLLLIAGCGGADSASSAPPGPETQQRAAAAATTAQHNPDCTAVQPFYWEIGDANQRLASGSVNAAGDTGAPVYTASTLMNIASASKWIYAAYVVQRQGGVLSDSDVSFLHLTSGYTNFSICLPWQTVAGCVDYLGNGVYDPSTAGAFYYGGGHMQKHAEIVGLGPLDNAGLAAEIQSRIGRDIAIAYSQPQLAAGVVTTADAYGLLLRKMLGGTLLLGRMLGADAVCTNPATCPPGAALATPIPTAESWHYSLGHWVEDDPAVGDGAFNSAGAFGFYPWIDATRTWYGIVARRTAGGDNAGYASARCGRLIRKAWVSGMPQ